MMSVTRRWRDRAGELDELEYALCDIVAYMSEGFDGTCLDEQDDVLHMLVVAHKTIGARTHGLKKALDLNPGVKQEFEKIKLHFAPGREC